MSEQLIVMSGLCAAPFNADAKRRLDERAIMMLLKRREEGRERLIERSR
jgi:hypothetical protein